MNVVLLEKIVVKLTESPHLFTTSFEQRTHKGMAYCVGGWAAVLSGKKVKQTTIPQMAELLGFNFEQFFALCMDPDLTVETAILRIHQYINSAI